MNKTNQEIQKEAVIDEVRKLKEEVSKLNSFVNSSFGSMKESKEIYIKILRNLRTRNIILQDRINYFLRTVEEE